MIKFNNIKKKIYDFLCNKSIVLLGLGKSNLAIAEILSDFNFKFHVCDKSQNLNTNLDKIAKKNVEFHLGSNYIEYLNNLNPDIIFRSPGIMFSQENLVKSNKKNVKITSEIEFFFEFCPFTTIGVTGSDGKTTVSTVISKILEKSGVRTFLGGNIGRPLISELINISQDNKKNIVFVIELSSFQLISFRKSPDISVITNISPNHLDIHKNYEEYIESKKNIFKYQDKNSGLVLNFDDNLVNSFSKEAQSSVIFFSTEKKIENGLFLDENSNIIFRDNNKNMFILNKKDIKIPGKHNLKNFMAAIGSVIKFNKKFNKNLIDIIKEVAYNFLGVEHRIEFVREINNIKYYNDSIASSPTRTMYGALSVFTKNVIIIAGGYDKKISYKEFGEFLSKDKLESRTVKAIILMGQTASKIEESICQALGEFKPLIFNVQNMQSAISKSQELSEPGDIVVLSPASASFDLYQNFEQRGLHFKEIVNNLI
ncbi:MAG: UDP-N-acetylmuramoyl-L-alanine--D-glutamate ligase [Candidatus Improbicoccus devescovinae]|nr:MAG: UDP-N-acetylmuramoyl-L-alanine--D-glutamate ligase [Candidatus Improbicoccus devescovinae]